MANAQILRKFESAPEIGAQISQLRPVPHTVTLMPLLVSADGMNLLHKARAADPMAAHSCLPHVEVKLSFPKTRLTPEDVRQSIAGSNSDIGGKIVHDMSPNDIRNLSHIDFYKRSSGSARRLVIPIRASLGLESSQMPTSDDHGYGWFTEEEGLDMARDKSAAFRSTENGITRKKDIHCQLLYARLACKSNAAFTTWR